MENLESQNSQGQYAMYNYGKFIGWTDVTLIDGCKVANEYLPFIKQIIASAQVDGIILTIGSGFRTWQEQYNLREQNIIDKTKVNDKNYLCTADNGLFYPRTGQPGYSNHQNGDAIDFNVTGYPAKYSWLVHNAIKHGWIRTVPSERWHWQYLPHNSPFDYVKQNDPTWDNLV